MEEPSGANGANPIVTGSNSFPGGARGSSAVTSLCFTIVSIDGLDADSRAAETLAQQKIKQLCEEGSKLHGCEVGTTSCLVKQISNQKGRQEFQFCLRLEGETNDVALTRAFLLRQQRHEAVVTIKTNRKIILNKNGEMKSVVKARIGEIMKSTNTQITCLGHTFDEQLAPPGLAPDIMDVEIMGDWNGVEGARLKCLVLLDEMAGMSSDRLEIDLELQPIIAGKKRAFLESLMQESLCSIYMPPPFRTVLAGAKDEEMDVNYVYITGVSNAVSETKERLRAIASAKAPSVVRKQVICMPKKLDWMLVSRKEQLRKIMVDNGVFLCLPSIGTGKNFIVVSGDDPVYIERAIRAVMAMACEFYCLNLLFDATGSQSLDQQATVSLAHICNATGSEVSFQGCHVEIFGLKTAVKSSFQQINEIMGLSVSLRDAKFQVELALEHKEFINGKKSGKINKIDEFPAEMSFYIPEAFHKRIIGVGGKNIQRIMKKYGVYVKFSNAEEFANLGGYFENMDNVIARTPSKNAANLDHLRQSIFELINIKDKSEITTVVMIPWQFHRIVMGPRAANVKEIERSLRVTIVFPEKCLGSDEVMISGPEAQVHQARIQLHQLIPEVHDFIIPASHVAIYVIKSPDFYEGLVQRIQMDFNIQLFVQTPPLDDFSGHDCLFMLYYHRGNTNIERAKYMILEYLKAKQVPIYPHPGVQRSGSYANLAPQKSYDSFQHFNSKLLSPVTSGYETSGSALRPEP
ncbi:hypothetical protein HDU96_002278 [Phlyctochytrium bullatum]|nr:hypothetical protein HDU96_002278 [Phlyctochytrium bullatum]